MKRATIMVVDDDPGMVELLCMRLGAMGYATQSAGDGPSALQLLKKELPDLLISDLRMDEMDGLALFERVHKAWPSLPVIVVTAHGSIPEAVTAIQQGVFSFLTKPVDKDELAQVIESALAHSQPHGGEENQTGLENEIKTRSANMLHVLEQARMLANSAVNVLINGESGTGKELLARSLHAHSRRRDKPFIAVNCSAVPMDMLESELFGHVKGAFTGASRDHEGLVKAADGGVLFLDEIGDMPYALQAKILRVLQEKRVRPVGATTDFAVDIRVLSATHRDLHQAIELGDFREDLFYRLNVVNMTIPALRERREDILYLADYFLNIIAQREATRVRQLSPSAKELLLDHHWPGNIRQLENVMEQVAALSPSPIISDTLIANAIGATRKEAVASLSEAKREFEREYVADLLRLANGNIPLAAKMAGRNRSDFYKIVHRHKLDVELFKEGE